MAFDDQKFVSPLSTTFHIVVNHVGRTDCSGPVDFAKSTTANTGSSTLKVRGTGISIWPDRQPIFEIAGVEDGLGTKV